jgi:predicted aspartyl protease
MKRCTVLSLLFALLMSGSLTSAQTNAAQSNNVHEAIPARLYHGYLMVVQGNIGNLGKRNLAIDTGAFPSVIDKNVAKKLHLIANHTELRVVDRNLNSEAASVPTIEIGSLHANGVRAVVEDLTPISENLGVHLDAIIGLDVLAARNFRIDYSAKKLIFDPSDALPMSAPMSRVDSMACIDLQVDERPARLLLDTGGASVLLFANRLPWAATLIGTAHTYTNLGGTFRSREIPLRSLVLHKTSLGSTPIYVSDARNLSDFPFDGLLATGALPVRQIEFDFKHQLFGWEPSSSKKDASRLREIAEAKPGFALTPAAPMSNMDLFMACSPSMGLCGPAAPVRMLSNK